MQKKYCVNCFLIIELEAASCSRCKYPQDKVDNPAYLHPPFRLVDQYYIGRMLGQGGFAFTYLGYDKHLGTLVAIKEYFPLEFATRGADGLTVVPYPGQAGVMFQAGKEKFITEARLLAGFRSSNIIKIRHFFTANNTAYFAMEYLLGATLTQQLEKNGGRLAFAQAKAVLMPLLDALDEVHQK
ncbi:MAG: serine/threonine protein kinase, partial [Candidatus Sericytochromatia bacterium]